MWSELPLMTRPVHLAVRAALKRDSHAPARRSHRHFQSPLGDLMPAGQRVGCRGRGRGPGPSADWIAGMVVGVPGLALKSEKGGDPPIGAGEPEEQAAVMPHAVVAGVAAGARVALVHVNVVDAAVGLELEGRVRLVL